MKKVLQIAYHYPPSSGTSGIQRTLKFTQYLPEFGFEPVLLTVNPMAYPGTNQGQMFEIPNDLIIQRCFALDTARHLSIGGRYPGVLALPDRWWTWILSAVPTGLFLIKKYRPVAIWSTYPISSAHVIGLILSRISGLPWVADFRDTMTKEGYPVNPLQRRIHRAIESKTIHSASKSIFTTRGSVAMYSERYPSVPEGKMGVIENAWDEETFRSLDLQDIKTSRSSEAPITLLHSGTIYPSERDPRAFFRAIHTITKNPGAMQPKFRIVLRATGHDAIVSELIKEAGIEDVVTLAPKISYRDAIQEILETDVLLILQASNCNNQIPAKLYEYFRAKRPILALTDLLGDTAKAIRDADAGFIMPLDNQSAIEEQFPIFLRKIQNNQIECVSDKVIEQNTRKARTEALSSVFNEVQNLKSN